MPARIGNIASSLRLHPHDLNGIHTIGIIGAGNIGSQVARLAVARGDEVVSSNSRGPETLDDLVAELGSKVRAATSTEAGAAGDLVVVSVPLKGVGDIPVEPLANKSVIDTNNYYRSAMATSPSSTTRPLQPRSCCSVACRHLRW